MRQLRAGDRYYRNRKVRLISQDNTQLGVVSFNDAVARAEEAGLDLVEMPSKTEPPVCRIMNFGKYQFDEAKRLREARKAQIQPKIKELKMGPTIDDNDFQIKSKRAVDFLKKGDKVRALIVFRGREMSHPEIGQQLMQRLIESLKDVSILDAPPRRMGRNITAVLAPNPELRKTLAKAAREAKNARMEKSKKDTSES
ncbi:MAG: translation initiation factor IF-3 [Lentisphaeria bacterium]